MGATCRSLHTRRREHLRDAKNGSPMRLHRAIRKYGPDAFVFREICRVSCRNALPAEETRIIAAFKPRYNATEGGLGAPGHTVSASSRKRIGELSKGNSYRLGMTHTPETRAVLRAVGLRCKEEFLKRSHLGPAASAKPVRCLDDGNVFESASAAARHYGVAKSALIELCLRNPRRKTVGGRVFRYVESEHS